MLPFGMVLYPEKQDSPEQKGKAQIIFLPGKGSKEKNNFLDIHLVSALMGTDHLLQLL